VSGSWIAPDRDPRESDYTRGERATLVEYLRAYRLTLELKCQDLTPVQPAQRSVPPSSLSLLGLVRHMADVEFNWFRRVMGRRPDVPRMWGKSERRDGDFDGAAGTQECVDEAFTLWRAEIAYAESVVDASESLDVTGLHGAEGEIELREVLVHMIEEYARHCGHADLLRECIDGRTGQ
jgi:uncharacterized damage-inducible protein DinB